MNEAPELANAQATVAENSANGTIVTTLAGTDVDAGATLGYAITAGMLPVTLQSTPIPESSPSPAPPTSKPTAYALTVQVSDGSLTDEAIVTIAVADANDAPILVDANGIVVENSVAGTAIMTITGTDADGDGLSYAITPAFRRLLHHRCSTRRNHRQRTWR